MKTYTVFGIWLDDAAIATHVVEGDIETAWSAPGWNGLGQGWSDVVEAETPAEAIDAATENLN